MPALVTGKALREQARKGADHAIYTDRKQRAMNPGP